VTSHAAPRRPGQAQPGPCSPPHARLPAGARAQQPPGVVHERKDRYEAEVRTPMVALASGGRRLRRLRAGSGREPRTSMYRPYPATRDSRRTRLPSRPMSGPFSLTACCPKHEGRVPTWRSRRTTSGSAEACTCPRAPCSTKCGNTSRRARSLSKLVGSSRVQAAPSANSGANN